jgi:MFS family permease
VLHGFCFDFFFIAGSIYVDNEAPRDIRASGQALFSFLAYGIGMWLGSLLAGKLMTVYAGDWYRFWLVPCIGILISLTVFVIFFRPHRQTPVREDQDKPTGATDPTNSDVYIAEHQARIQSGEAGVDL